MPPPPPLPPPCLLQYKRIRRQADEVAKKKQQGLWAQAPEDIARHYEELECVPLCTPLCTYPGADPLLNLCCGPCARWRWLMCVFAAWVGAQCAPLCDGAGAGVAVRVSRRLERMAPQEVFEAPFGAGAGGGGAAAVGLAAAAAGLVPEAGPALPALTTDPKLWMIKCKARVVCAAVRGSRFAWRGGWWGRDLGGTTSVGCVCACVCDSTTFPPKVHCGASATCVCGEWDLPVGPMVRVCS